jgi:glyoxylase-like metal-dependent hydrolase (beta-lactamase superfamily II)
LDGYGTIGHLAIEQRAAASEVIDGVYLVRSPLWGPVDVISPASIYIGTVVIASGADVVVVDPGLAHHPQTYLQPFLRDREIDPNSISLVVNSHDHFDHVLGNPALRQMCGAPIAAHAAAVSTIPGGVDRTLSDGDIITCGDMSFEVVYSPGHSPTAISLWCRERRLLVSGDSIQGNGDYSQGLPILTDIAAYESTLQRLLGLEAETLVTAHLYRYQSAPVLTGSDVADHIKDSLMWCRLYEREIGRLLRESTKPLSRTDLHARLVEEHAWHPEEARLFTLHFLSAWSRPTIEAYLSQCVPAESLGHLTDEAWPDVGQLAESNME